MATIYNLDASPKRCEMRGQITISVDADLAEFYYSAPDSERRKLDLIINLRLRNFVNQGQRQGQGRPLLEIMDDISRKAQQRGLTPEILQSILDEE